MPAGSTAAASFTRGYWGCIVLSGVAMTSVKIQILKTPLLCFQNGHFSRLFCGEFHLDLHRSGNFYI